MCVLIRTDKHAERFIIFDEAHAAHVRGEIEDLIGALANGIAVVLQIQVQHQVLDIVGHLVPFIQRLDVHRPNLRESLPAKIRNQRSADESSRTCHDCQTVSHQSPIRSE